MYPERLYNERQPPTHIFDPSQCYIPFALELRWKYESGMKWDETGDFVQNILKIEVGFGCTMGVMVNQESIY